jgi:AraC-like DNA-binding protein
MSSRGFERDIPMIPIAYLTILLRFLRRSGIAPDAVLAGSGISPAALTDPEAYLSIAQHEFVIERAMALLPRPGLGFEYGLELDLSAHGLLGFSVLRRVSLRELVRMLVDYLRIRLPLMELRLQTRNGAIELQVEESWPLGKARQFIVETYLGSIYALAAPAFRDLEICLTIARPSSAAFEKHVRCAVMFSQQANLVRLRIDRMRDPVTDRLDTTLYADQTARTALACEEGFGIVLRVRHCIMRDPGRNSTLESVAAELGLSPRSLRRHLQVTGASFSDLRNVIRRQFALRYLRASSLPLDAIADRLGYGDQASFTRAFREWTGISPGRYRRGDDVTRGITEVPGLPGEQNPAA